MPSHTLNLDGGDRVLFVGLVLLGDEGDQRQEAAVSALYLFSLEAFGYGLDKGHSLLMEEGQLNNQQALE